MYILADEGIVALHGFSLHGRRLNNKSTICPSTAALAAEFRGFGRCFTQPQPLAAITYLPLTCSRSLGCPLDARFGSI
jgi:hypothetical protein